MAVTLETILLFEKAFFQMACLQQRSIVIVVKCWKMALHFSFQFFCDMQVVV